MGRDRPVLLERTCLPVVVSVLVLSSGNTSTLSVVTCEVGLGGAD